ncbi:hypothetical protein [Bacillus suaedaesalsae]|uniref:Family 2 glycosyl transferase n=1 Tax=Bacillus suaedaesalsae TaxID=2810349 RepID=A0ABS2DGP4_9BACI|nr:hypothetical protein [Bacillus suaedaesalsae]MBM6617644.1 hypothetical protein [Bacillus suaedaesalsae]
MKHKWKSFIYFGVMFLIVAIVSSPFWVWQLLGESKFNVLIVDKTVPDTTYREHKGLSWLLNQNKYVQNDGTTYDYTKDYVGFHPQDDKKFSIKQVPAKINSYDLIYVADGYGVYEDEFYGENPEGARSESLYGGMTLEEVNSIKDAVVQIGTPLMVEFNTFANPTETPVRSTFYELLNLKWSGWIGRYFSDLNSTEVPVWVRMNYEKQSGEKWKFKGKGLVLADESDKVVVVNSEGLNDEGVLYQLTKKGKEVLDGAEEELYQYWFDIVQAENENEVLATYTLPLNGEGKKLLTQLEIPFSFPAIIHHQTSKYETYYFAGDFADQDEVPSIYQTVGLKKWRQWFTSESEGSTAAFYWKVYVPMMDGIMKEMKGKTKNKQNVNQNIKVMTENGVKISGKSSNEYLQVLKDGQWENILIKGVNLGIAKPGSFPGETSISKQEYMQWFNQIGEMNANAIRVYTIHPPGFYEALYEYNQTADYPIYLFHGVWLNEEVFYESMDAYSAENVKEFKDEITRVVDLLHGNATLPEKVGHASGSYIYDLSPYILGYMLGVEWDPEVVRATNEKHKGTQDYSGQYVYTKGGNPFEIWLAEMMDYTINYETTTYKWQHPMSFTNWVTTDLLEHPTEPSEKEDLVSINPNVIYSTDQHRAGMFASYHIYPYYPEFLNLEKKYVEYTDHRGERNNYAGYLNDMKNVHNMPVMVAEFGVPGSRGITHRNIQGLDQGHHSEREQGEIIVRLFEDIVEEKMAGGLVFVWQDEWFKRTWNTMDYDNPDRRPFWSNIQTSEQNFGLLSFDPGKKGFEIRVDGKIQDWTNQESKLYENEDLNLWMHHDERYVYIRVDSEMGIDMDQKNTYLLINTLPNHGQQTIPNVKEVQGKGIDFVVQLNGTETSNVVVDANYDTYYYHYHKVLNMIPKENEIYHPIRLALNKELSYTNEEGQTITNPFDYAETGKLQIGDANPNSGNYNSLTDYALSDDKKTLELRLPWMLLNFKDPSQLEIIGEMHESNKGIKSSIKTEGIKIGVVQTDKNHQFLQSMPEQNDLDNESAYTLYKWDSWDTPTYQERLKKSYYLLQESFHNYK